MLACMLFPQAKIAVVTKSVPVLTQRLYPALALNLPSVGLVGGGNKMLGRRVTCYSADSLHHAGFDEDFVFVDEGHQACADGYAERMSRFEHARVWMFSATWDMRLDNKDMRAEAMSGPVRCVVPFSAAQEHGMIVPVAVILTDVVMDMNPCGGDMDLMEKKRHGIWTNDYRNQLIAADAQLYDDDTQTLITVETIEHGLHLQRLLPDFEFVYAGQGVKGYQIRRFQDAGLIPADWRMLTDERRARLTRRFEKGLLKKVIATSVWNVGVNFKRLQIIIRADAGGSPINDTQIPGRAVRIDEDTGKQIAIVHDYLDQFDTGFKRKADRRVKSYEANDWTIHRPRSDKKSLLRQLLE